MAIDILEAIPITSVQRNSVSENTKQIPSTIWPYFGRYAPGNVAEKILLLSQ